MPEEYQGEDRRSGVRRSCEKGYCPLHSERDRDITEMKETLFNDIKPRVYSQDGKLTILIWAIGLFCVASLSLVVSMAVFSASMDKTFTAYIASHTVESSRWIDVIGDNKKDIQENQKVISIILENQKEDKKLLQKIEKALRP